MRTFAIALLVLAALGIGPAAGCSRADAPAPAAALPAVTVDELAGMLARNECQPVDANGDPTRERMGIIPGSVLLSDYDTFQLTELPADKSRPLVFYCAGPACTASHAAAERAIAAGHTQVKLLPAGIAGWVKAGKQTARL